MVSLTGSCLFGAGRDARSDTSDKAPAMLTRRGAIAAPDPRKTAEIAASTGRAAFGKASFPLCQSPSGTIGANSIASSSVFSTAGSAQLSWFTKNTLPSIGARAACTCPCAIMFGADTGIG